MSSPAVASWLSRMCFEGQSMSEHDVDKLHRGGMAPVFDWLTSSVFNTADATHIR